MSRRIRDEDVVAVRDHSSLVDLVREQVILRDTGGGNLKGLCPIHAETTPSFHVTPARGLFYCFGCGKGGDVFRYVMETADVAFVEAVERLAVRAGVTVRYVDEA